MTVITGRFFVSFGLVILFQSACAPETAPLSSESGAADGPGKAIARYVSNKKVNTVCKVFDVPSPPPGFAEAPGVPQKDMPPRLATRMAVGADREPVDTDWDRVSPGYVLVEPAMIRESMLINNEGQVVGRIESDGFHHTQLLPSGNRLVLNTVHTDVFRSGGRQGCIEEFAADGELVWRLGLATNDYIQHHDAIKLPNGNVLAVVWEKVSKEEAIMLGRNPEFVTDNGRFWYDGIIEVDPFNAEIVWEWSARHHLVQDYDAGKANYGVVAEHPELLNINSFQLDNEGKISESGDWTHVNALDYNADLDLIVISSNYMSEVFVIDHSTTPWEAASHGGGRHGRGGDFLYRWGNAENYDRGGAADRTLFNQHDIQWIKEGLPGAGNLLVFNNGNPDARPYSTVVEFAPEMSDDGSFVLHDGEPYSTDVIVWEYNPEPPERFYSFFISGAQRLLNGNTIITQGAGAMIREVTRDGEIVWDYSYSNENDDPHMLFRGNRYPAGHPGIAGFTLAQ